MAKNTQKQYEFSNLRYSHRSGTTTEKSKRRQEHGCHANCPQNLDYEKPQKKVRASVTV